MTPTELVTSAPDKLTKELYGHCIAVGEAGADLLRLACLTSWCSEQGGVIAEVGEAIAYAIARMGGDATKLDRRTLSAAAVHRIVDCSIIFNHMGVRYPPVDARTLDVVTPWAIAMHLRELTRGRA